MEKAEEDCASLQEFCEKRFEPWIESTTAQKTWLDFYRVGFESNQELSGAVNLKVKLD